MNNGFTSFDKAWVPFVIACAGLLGYYGVTSPEQSTWIVDTAPAGLAMVAQAVLVFWRKNKA